MRSAIDHFMPSMQDSWANVTAQFPDLLLIIPGSKDHLTVQAMIVGQLKPRIYPSAVRLDTRTPEEMREIYKGFFTRPEADSSKNILNHISTGQHQGLGPFVSFSSAESVSVHGIAYRLWKQGSSTRFYQYRVSDLEAVDPGIFQSVANLELVANRVDLNQITQWRRLSYDPSTQQIRIETHWARP